MLLPPLHPTHPDPSALDSTTAYLWGNTMDTGLVSWGWTICTITQSVPLFLLHRCPVITHWYICLKEALHATFYPDLHVTLSKGKSDSTTEMILILRIFSHDGIDFPWPKKKKNTKQTNKNPKAPDNSMSYCRHLFYLWESDGSVQRPLEAEFNS